MSMSVSGPPWVVSIKPSSTPDVGSFKQPRIIKQFTDLLGVTIGTSNATVVSSIDPNSPFNCPALKLVITFTTTAGRVEVTPPAVNIPSFNGHLGYTLWIDDATKMGQCSVFVGTTGYALYSQANHLAFSGGDLIAGPRAVYAGPIRQNSVIDGGFVFGTSSAQDHKLRISAPTPNLGTCTVWVKDCWIAQPQRPVVCFTFDDGFDSWVTTANAEMSKYGFKGTFAINSDQIDKGATGITSANVLTLIAAGHQASSHNQFNYKLLTLFGQGNGENSGTGTSQDATSYLADYHVGRRAYEAKVADVQDFMYHPWVQGGMETMAADGLSAAGVDLARTTSPYEAQLYGFPIWRNALALRAFPLDNTKTLAQVKAQVDLAVLHGGLVVLMGHDFGASTGAAKWASQDFADLCAYVASLGSTVDVLTMRQLRDRLLNWGLLETRRAPGAGTQQPVRVIGTLLGANMNSTADQAITLAAGSWKIEGVYATKPSVSLTTAAGGVYTSTAKGGTAIVAAGQVYSGLVAATDVIGCTMAATPTVTNNTVYLSLTTAQGAAATADVFVYGRPA